MQKLFRNLTKFIALVMTIGLLILNLRLYHPGGAAYAQPRLGTDVVPQLRSLSSTLRTGGGDNMQALFPEGYFLTHVLYGLAWVEVGLRVEPTSAVYAEALTEARWALARLESSAGRAPFPATLNPPYGVFYLGWRSWLEGGVLLMQPQGALDPLEVEKFEKDTTTLAAAFESSATPFLQSYTGQSWPVDNTVAIAALRLHDKLLPPKFETPITNWIVKAKSHLDPKTGLLPHRVDPRTGEALAGARGSSQSVINYFLIEIDPEWATEQYSLYRQQFIAPFLGVPGVREYPSGVWGLGDVDSGPLVFGFSASATVVEIGTAQLYGDDAVAAALIPASEAVGLPLSWGESKNYMFGLLPVGEAFLVWAKTSSRWVASPPVSTWPDIVNPNWRWPFHGVALILAGLVWWPFFRRKRN